MTSWFQDTPRSTPARAWCHGKGWNSTAGILADIERGKPIDLITSADHGGEKRRPDPSMGEEIGTYEFGPVFADYLRSHGYPEPVECRYRPLPATSKK